MATFTHKSVKERRSPASTHYPLPFRLAMRIRGTVALLGLRKHEPLLPRLLFMGADPGDVFRTMEAIHWPEQWSPRWCALARSYEEQGQKALQRKHWANTADALRLAAVYYRIAEYMTTGPDERADIWRKLVICYRTAGQFFTPPLTELQVQVDGLKIPAWMRVPINIQKAPCLLILGGVDGVKEEWYRVSQGYIERGWACAAIDLPGQGELRRLHNCYWRPDVEPVLSAVIDSLEQHPSIDSRCIAVVGGSAGGYFALRAAAHEPRISACALISAPVSLYEVYRTAPRPIPQTMDYNLGSDTQATSLQLLQAFTVEPFLARVHCPVWQVYGGKDTTTPPHHAKLISQGVAGKVTEVGYSDGDHVCFNHLVDWQLQLYDWLETHFQSIKTAKGE